jgi:hypothetical protein
MTTRLVDAMPTVDTLTSAGNADVAAIILAHANARHGDNSFSRHNLVIEMAEPYLQDKSVQKPLDAIRHIASRVVSEAVGWRRRVVVWKP